jgi:hypothetical protein
MGHKHHPHNLSFLNSISLHMRMAMDMPDSPQPSSTSSPSATTSTTWSSLHSSLPVSYQVAIALDAFVLFITFTALLLLAVYIRRQIARRKALESDDLEMKCCGDEGRDSLCNDRAPVHEGRKSKTSVLLGKLRRSGLSQGGDRNGGEEKTTRMKKGHVRWTSSVEALGPDCNSEKIAMKAGHASAPPQDTKTDSNEWQTDTWGSSSRLKAKRNMELGLRTGMGMSAGVGMGVGLGQNSGFRVNPLGRSWWFGGLGGIGQDGRWERGSLWKGYGARRERERLAMMMNGA